MSVQCKNCGATLSDAFVRVFYPEDERVTECLHCPNIREHGFQPPTTHDNSHKI